MKPFLFVILICPNIQPAGRHTELLPAFTAQLWTMTDINYWLSGHQHSAWTWMDPPDPPSVSWTALWCNTRGKQRAHRSAFCPVCCSNIRYNSADNATLSACHTSKEGILSGDTATNALTSLRRILHSYSPVYCRTIVPSTPESYQLAPKMVLQEYSTIHISFPHVCLSTLIIQ